MGTTVGLSCKVSIRSMMQGRLELMWLLFHVIMWMCVVEVCVCCVGGGNCIVRVVFRFGVHPIMGWLHLMSSWTNWCESKSGHQTHMCRKKIGLHVQIC